MKGKILIVFTILLSLVGVAQVGIGTTNPDDSSILDITASDKGILVPRVFLSSIATTMLDGVNTASTGLLIYNTNTAVTGGSGVGYYYFNGTTWERLTTTTDSSEKWSLTGDAGTAVGTNFLGTTDNNALSFRTNNTEKLRISTQGKIGIYNTGRSVFMGESAGNGDNLSNNYNIAIGYNSLMSATNSNFNTAVGAYSLENASSGTGNVALGYQSMESASSGNYNTAIGTDALRAANTGDYNLALGSAAMYDNTSGSYNIGLGTAALGDNTSGVNNVGVGFHALRENTIGTGNVGIGYRSLYNNLSGINNTALGIDALYFKSSGDENVSIGIQSGYGNLIGSGNVFLGAYSGYNDTGSNKLYIENSNADDDNALIYGEFDNNILRTNGILEMGQVGNGLYLEIENMGASNMGIDGDIVPYAGSATGFDLGNNTATEHWDDVVANGFITYSDRNTKNEIQPLSYGLKEVLKLNPVTYRYKSFISPNNRKRMGLIAQEVENIIPEVVIAEDVDLDENGNKVVSKGDYKAMNYTELIPVLIRSIQEQNNRIDKLEREIELLKKGQ